MQRVARMSPAWNATLRTTCVATQLEGGHAKNALPQLAAATVNCRVLPEDSVGYVTVTLKQVIADTAVKWTVVAIPQNGPPSPIPNSLMPPLRTLTTVINPRSRTL